MESKDLSRRQPRAGRLGGEAQARSFSTDVLESDRALSLARCEIAEGFYRGGDLVALELLAAASLRLYGHVIAGDLFAPDVFDALHECAANLGIADRGIDDVQAALAYGPKIYGDVARAA